MRGRRRVVNTANNGIMWGWVARMAKLMVWAALAGVVIGLVLLSVEGTLAYLDPNDGAVTVYGGGYGSIQGQDALDADTEAELDRYFIDAAKWWNQLTLPWWAYPLIGAGSAAVLAAPFAIAGVRVTRVRR